MNALNDFNNKFVITNDTGNSESPDKIGNLNLYPDLKETTGLLGGKSFNRGLIRVYRGDHIERATKALIEAYPEYANKVIVFAADWLGRQFAVDYRRMKNGAPQILLAEIGVGKALAIPCSIIDFYNTELVEYTNDALAVNFFNDWINANNADVSYEECIGYKIPLFLGGGDVLENLERINMEFYIDICGQLRNQTIHLENGMKISDVTIELKQSGTDHE